MKTRYLLVTLTAMLLLFTAVHGDTIPRGEAIPNAFTVRITEDALNMVGDSFEAYVNDNFQSMMEEQLPIKVYDDGCFWEYTAYITDIYSITFDWPQLTIDTSRPYMNFSFHVSNFHMHFLLWGEGAFCLDEYDCDSDVYFDNLDGSAQGYFIVNDDKIRTIMTGADVNMSGYEFDTEGECFIIELIAEILESTIEESFEEAMEDYLMYDLPQVLDDGLSTLSIQDTMDILGKTMNYKIYPEELPIDDNGVTLSMNGLAYAPRDRYCPPYFPGSRYTPSDPPEYGTEVPGMQGQEYDLAMSLSDDLTNQALFAIYDTGGFCMMMDQHSEDKYGFSMDLTTTDLKLFLPELYNLAPDAPFSLALVPTEPFYVTIGTGSGILEGQMNLVMPHCHLDGYIELYGRNVRAFSCDTSINTELMMYITNHNSVRMIISSAPDVDVDLVWEGLVDLNDDIFEVVTPFLLEILIPAISLVLPEIELPSIEGYQFNLISFVPDGPSEDYLSIYGSLTEVPGYKRPPKDYSLTRKYE